MIVPITRAQITTYLVLQKWTWIVDWMNEDQL